MTDPGAAPSVRTALLGTRRIMGSPYTVVVLQEGYHQPTPDGGARADGTVTLLRGPLPMLVDTGGPWGRERLLAALVGEGLAPADIKHVVCTHGHSDHAGNLNLFPAAELLVGFDRSAPGADQYLPVGLVEGRPHALDPGHVEVVATPGHVAAHTSVVIVITAIHFQAAGHRGCCGNRCGMFLSMLMAVLGIGGAIYAMTVSGLALVRGPLCQYLLPEGNLSDWGRPFQGPPWKSDDDDDFRKSSYLFHPELWGKCHNPPDVVKFNIILFSLILGGAVLELLLCTVQFFNSCAGCICGPRLRKRPATQH
ncbi:metallo-beta-lactamase domain-containing protein 1 isoform A [Alligator mississippiensis]|uniref:Metallo-beta-lactamase domain-containing protein 1 isoform A n=1 Tax=Alligator mississippiensis TaxID=8496 RepID=A0A151MCX2_ALLMI|nr:metallo-beta-lactamase domain-containing protein 1 isoform A [Alligator mississippiensis]